ncbi:hypothetical protein LX36DRAFT_391660 [Colletotrichum falcatum]|nr:hypothetical protein LX36DRAFT_391660 [Colletotrichum falcatum]
MSAKLTNPIFRSNSETTDLAESEGLAEHAESSRRFVNKSKPIIVYAMLPNHGTLVHLCARSDISTRVSKGRGHPATPALRFGPSAPAYASGDVLLTESTTVVGGQDSGAVSLMSICLFVAAQFGLVDATLRRMLDSKPERDWPCPPRMTQHDNFNLLLARTHLQWEGRMNQLPDGPDGLT